MMEYLVFGSGSDHMANLLGLGRGWSGAKGSDFSHAEALETRGDIDGATKIYKEAIDALRRALSVARFSPQGEALAVREIHEISLTGLGDSARAAPDLVRYLERQPEGEHREWARRELAYIKERIREERQ
jgi:tetratricopeptide (TPR) repeat protein